MPLAQLGRLIRMSLGALVVVAVALLPALRPWEEASAHDIYFDLHSDGNVGGEEPRTLCCSGSEYDGDCEGILNFVIHQDGSAVFYSRRWKHDIQIAARKIVWMKLPGGEQYPAHFCGAPRRASHFEPPDRELQIDPEYLVYCAFVDPGGA